MTLAATTVLAGAALTVGIGHLAVQGAVQALASASTSVASIATTAQVGIPDLGAPKLDASEGGASNEASVLAAVQAVRALASPAQVDRACTALASGGQQREALTRAVRASLPAGQTSLTDAQLDQLMTKAGSSLCSPAVSGP